MNFSNLIHKMKDIVGHPAVPPPQDRLSPLHADILRLIFQELNPTSLVQISLTCRKFRILLKSEDPSSIKGLMARAFIVSYTENKTCQNLFSQFAFFLPKNTLKDLPLLLVEDRDCLTIEMIKEPVVVGIFTNQVFNRKLFVVLKHLDKIQGRIHATAFHEDATSVSCLLVINARSLADTDDAQKNIWYSYTSLAASLQEKKIPLQTIDNKSVVELI
jgi:hypothetical protein